MVSVLIEAQRYFCESVSQRLDIVLNVGEFLLPRNHFDFIMFSCSERIIS